MDNQYGHQLLSLLYIFLKYNLWFYRLCGCESVDLIRSCEGCCISQRLGDREASCRCPANSVLDYN